MDYTKIIFVSKENVLLGPMAEWIMKSILMDKSKQIMSRGLVVLFCGTERPAGDGTAYESWGSLRGAGVGRISCRTGR